MNIYINNGEDIPNDDTCYIIAKGGIYLKKKLDLIESLTPVDKISFLEDIPTFAKINIPLISTRMFGNILGFFKEVYNLYKAEAIVLLYYDRNKKSYRVHAPEQEVSSGSLSYKSDKTIKDHILIGSIHSHGGMSAFHSGTDVADEVNFDGIHMTVGKVGDENFFDICGSIAVNGMRVPIEPKDYVSGIESVEYTPYFPQMFRPKFEEINGTKIYKNTVKTSSGYILNCNEMDYNFNSKWLKNVKEKKFMFVNNLTGSKYTFENGQLLKFDDLNTGNKVQGNFFFDNQTKNKSEDKCGVCKYCVHRKDKLTLEDCNQLEENLVSNFEYMNWI